MEKGGKVENVTAIRKNKDKKAVGKRLGTKEKGFGRWGRWYRGEDLRARRRKNRKAKTEGKTVRRHGHTGEK